MTEIADIPRADLIRRLRQEKFRFKREAKRVTLWHQKGTLRRVSVPKSDHLDLQEVTTILYQAGLGAEEMAEFLEPYRRERPRAMAPHVAKTGES